VPQRVDYVILYVKSLEQSIAFYRDVVGIPFKFSSETFAEFATENTKFALMDSAALPDLIGRERMPAAGASEVCFVVDDVDAEATRLNETGVEILSGPTDRVWGHRTLHFLDPDGHIVEFAKEIPRA
jgi:lactoylglutathione lyase